MIFLFGQLLELFLEEGLATYYFYQIENLILNPFYLFYIWKGGMSFHGGLIGMILAIYFFSKKHNINFFYLSDLVSTVAPIGLFFGRIANFINTRIIWKNYRLFL